MSNFEEDFIQPDMVTIDGDGYRSVDDNERRDDDNDDDTVVEDSDEPLPSGEALSIPRQDINDTVRHTVANQIQAS